MESLLPSEIARLVLGYLLEERECEAAAQLFLEKSDHLRECLLMAKRGRKFETAVAGSSLDDILDDYCAINSAISEQNQEFIDSLPKTGGTAARVQHILRLAQSALNDSASNASSVVTPQNSSSGKRRKRSSFPWLQESPSQDNESPSPVAASRLSNETALGNRRITSGLETGVGTVGTSRLSNETAQTVYDSATNQPITVVVETGVWSVGASRLSNETAQSVLDNVTNQAVKETDGTASACGLDNETAQIVLNNVTDRPVTVGIETGFVSVVASRLSNETAQTVNLPIAIVGEELTDRLPQFSVKPPEENDRLGKTAECNDVISADGSVCPERGREKGKEGEHAFSLPATVVLPRAKSSGSPGKSKGTPLKAMQSSSPVRLATSQPASEATPMKATPVKDTPVKATPVKATPVKASPVKCTPVKATPVKATPVEATPVKAISVKATPVEATLVKVTPVEGTPVKASVKATPVKATPIKATPVKATPVKATPVKATPVKATPVKATPVKAAPVRTALTSLTLRKATPRKTTPSKTIGARNKALSDEDDSSSLDFSIFTHVLENSELHQHLASHINQVIRGEEPPRPPDQPFFDHMADELSLAIKTIVSQTEQDPFFDRLLDDIIGPPEEASMTYSESEQPASDRRDPPTPKSRRSRDKEAKASRDLPYKGRLRSATKSVEPAATLEDQNNAAIEYILGAGGDDPPLSYVDIVNQATVGEDTQVIFEGDVSLYEGAAPKGVVSISIPPLVRQTFNQSSVTILRPLEMGGGEGGLQTLFVNAGGTVSNFQPNGYHLSSSYSPPPPVLKSRYDTHGYLKILPKPAPTPPRRARPPPAPQPPPPPAVPALKVAKAVRPLTKTQRARLARKAKQAKRKAKQMDVKPLPVAPPIGLPFIDTPLKVTEDNLPQLNEKPSTSTFVNRTARIRSRPNLVGRQKTRSAEVPDCAEREEEKSEGIAVQVGCTEREEESEEKTESAVIEDCVEREEGSAEKTESAAVEGNRDGVTAELGLNLSKSSTSSLAGELSDLECSGNISLDSSVDLVDGDDPRLPVDPPTDTPAPLLVHDPTKRMSHSTPRRSKPHIRALDFSTPPKYRNMQRRARTSPKGSARKSPRSILKGLKLRSPPGKKVRSILFTSPRGKLQAIQEQQGLEVVAPYVGPPKSIKQAQGKLQEAEVVDTCADAQGKLETIQETLAPCVGPLMLAEAQSKLQEADTVAPRVEPPMLAQGKLQEAERLAPHVGPPMSTQDTVAPVFINATLVESTHPTSTLAWSAPIATRTPRKQLEGDWDGATGVGMILGKSWDAKLRALLPDVPAVVPKRPAPKRASAPKRAAAKKADRRPRAGDSDVKVDSSEEEVARPVSPARRARVLRSTVKQRPDKMVVQSPTKLRGMKRNLVPQMSPHVDQDSISVTVHEKERHSLFSTPVKPPEGTVPKTPGLPSPHDVPETPLTKLIRTNLSAYVSVPSPVTMFPPTPCLPQSASSPRTCGAPLTPLSFRNSDYSPGSSYYKPSESPAKTTRVDNNATVVGENNVTIVETGSPKEPVACRELRPSEGCSRVVVVQRRDRSKKKLISHLTVEELIKLQMEAVKREIKFESKMERDSSSDSSSSSSSGSSSSDDDTNSDNEEATPSPRKPKPRTPAKGKKTPIKEKSPRLKTLRKSPTPRKRNTAIYTDSEDEAARKRSAEPPRLTAPGKQPKRRQSAAPRDVSGGNDLEEKRRRILGKLKGPEAVVKTSAKKASATSKAKPVQRSNAVKQNSAFLNRNVPDKNSEAFRRAARMMQQITATKTKKVFSPKKTLSVIAEQLMEQKGAELGSTTEDDRSVADLVIDESRVDQSASSSHRLDQSVNSSLLQEKVNQSVISSQLRSLDQSVSSSLPQKKVDQSVASSLPQKKVNQLVNSSLLQKKKDQSVNSSLLQKKKDQSVSSSLLQKKKGQSVASSLLQKKKGQSVASSLLQKKKDQSVASSLLQKALAGEAPRTEAKLNQTVSGGSGAQKIVESSASGMPESVRKQTRDSSRKTKAPAVLASPPVRRKDPCTFLNLLKNNDKDLARTQTPLKELARTQAPLKELARTQAPLKELARTQAPLKELARTQAPLKELDRMQAPLKELARTQAPLKELARTQAPLKELARTQAPLKELAGTQAPLKELARTQAPLKELARTQAPLNDLAGTQAPLKELAGTQVTLNLPKNNGTDLARTQADIVSPGCSDRTENSEDLQLRLSSSEDEIVKTVTKPNTVPNPKQDGTKRKYSYENTFDVETDMRSSTPLLNETPKITQRVISEREVFLEIVYKYDGPTSDNVEDVVDLNAYSLPLIVELPDGSEKETLNTVTAYREMLSINVLGETTRLKAPNSGGSKSSDPRPSRRSPTKVTLNGDSRQDSKASKRPTREKVEQRAFEIVSSPIKSLHKGVINRLVEEKESVSPLSNLYWDKPERRAGKKREEPSERRSVEKATKKREESSERRSVEKATKKREEPSERRSVEKGTKKREESSERRSVEKGTKKREEASGCRSVDVTSPLHRDKPERRAGKKREESRTERRSVALPEKRKRSQLATRQASCSKYADEEVASDDDLMTYALMGSPLKEASLPPKKRRAAVDESHTVDKRARINDPKELLNSFGLDRFLSVLHGEEKK